jgi:acetyl esterase/lipase
MLSSLLLPKGGAWVLGWYHRHRVLTAYIGLASRSRVVAVDYRLAPKYQFPASLDDCLSENMACIAYFCTLSP